MNDKTKSTPGRRAAWLELYTVQKSRASQPTRVADRGRPPRIMSLKSIHTTITESDETLLSNWRERVFKLTGRKITLGEVAGLLARICDDRLAALNLQDEPGSIEVLVDLLVSGQIQVSAPKRKSRTPE